MKTYVDLLHLPVQSYPAYSSRVYPDLPAPPTPAPVPTTVITPPPTAVSTTVPTTLIPLPTTTAPPIPLPTSIRDSPLLFTISAPVGYAGTTVRAPTSDYSILYKTTIFNPAIPGANGTINDNSGNYIELADSLTIFSYSTSTSVDQNIRNIIRSSGVVFNESVVTYNGVTYTRFEAGTDPYSGTPGKTVVFIGSKASANEKRVSPGNDLHDNPRQYAQPGNV